MRARGGSALRPTCEALLLELARARNAELQRENETLRRELYGARQLLDDALSLAAKHQAIAEQRTVPAVEPAATRPHASKGGEVVAGRVRHTVAGAAAMRRSVGPAVTTTAGRQISAPARHPHPGAAAGRGAARPGNALPSARSVDGANRAGGSAPNPHQDDEDERRWQSVAAARQAVAQRQAVMLAAVIRVQAVARGLVARVRLGRLEAEEAAAARLQAAVRGNAARGIVERRRWEDTHRPPRRRLVHPRG